MGQTFTQTAHVDADGVKIVSLAQTRDAVQEWITPMAFWELDTDTGLYMPPGSSSNPKKPQVKAELKGSFTAADGVANPTDLTKVAAFLQAFDGTDWERLRLDSQRNLLVRLLNSAGLDLQASAVGDGVDGSRSLSTGDYAFNGSTWDRWRNNAELTLLASATRTTTTDSPTEVNYNAKGVMVFLNVTGASGTGGLQLRFLGNDPVSGLHFVSDSPSAVTTTGINIYVLYPGAANAAGSIRQTTQTVLPRRWRVRVTHGDGSNYTYSVGASYIL